MSEPGFKTLTERRVIKIINLNNKTTAFEHLQHPFFLPFMLTIYKSTILALKHTTIPYLSPLNHPPYRKYIISKYLSFIVTLTPCKLHKLNPNIPARCIKHKENKGTLFYCSSERPIIKISSHLFTLHKAVFYISHRKTH